VKYKGDTTGFNDGKEEQTSDVEFMLMDGTPLGKY
jgi:hypothetical protein